MPKVGRRIIPGSRGELSRVLAECRVLTAECGVLGAETLRAPRFSVRFVPLGQQLALDPRSPLPDPCCQYDHADFARAPGLPPTG